MSPSPSPLVFRLGHARPAGRRPQAPFRIPALLENLASRFVDDEAIQQRVAALSEDFATIAELGVTFSSIEMTENGEWTWSDLGCMLRVMFAMLRESYAFAPLTVADAHRQIKGLREELRRYELAGLPEGTPSQFDARPAPVQ